MEIKLYERCQKYAEHFSGLCDIPCAIMDTVEGRILTAPADFFCTRCSCGRCEKISTHLYGCSEAYRWNGRYIYYCPMGLVFVASSISGDAGEMVGGVIAGPLIMGDPQDTVAELSEPSMTSAVAALPSCSTARVNHLAEVLAAVTSYCSGMPHSIAGSFVYEQDKLLNALYEIKNRLPEEGAASQYLIESEKRLHGLVGNRDKSGAQELLNDLLGHIYFNADFDLDKIKARVVELIVLLSRATIDAGADMNEILLCNTGYLREIEQFHSLEELSVWVTGIMHRFISYTFDFTQVKHSNVVHKVMEYVRSHYDQKITLDDLAQHVYLSRTYLSSIFKEETGQSLFAYINEVRVEKSKRLLLDEAIRLVDIAGLCGFEDQSYFTKVFKKLSGVSPKKYRDTHGKPSL